MIGNNPDLDRAIDCVRKACHVARAVQNDLEKVREITKDDRSPVTVADFAVQAIISMALGDAYIVGEEHAGELRKDDHAVVKDAVVQAVRSCHPNATENEVLDAIDRCNHDGTADRYWALDPIDGTKGFLRGQQYAIALGLIENGKVVMGVMGCPNLSADFSSPMDVPDPLGTIYAAVLGKGSWEISIDNKAEPKQVHTTITSENTGLRICESVEKAHSKRTDTDLIVQEFGGPAVPVRLDSQCKYAVVARGQADAYLRMPTSKTYVEKIWDHAAGSIIATEAGAIVTDLTGSKLDFNCGTRLEYNRGVVCAAPHVHARIIKAIGTLKIDTAV